MKITAVVGMWMCVVFALVCFGVAGQGFLAVSSMADESERDVWIGYAGFWAFLGAVATAFGILSWMIKQGKFGPVE